MRHEDYQAVLAHLRAQMAEFGLGELDQTIVNGLEDERPHALPLLDGYLEVLQTHLRLRSAEAVEQARSQVESALAETSPGFEGFEVWLTPEDRVLLDTPVEVVDLADEALKGLGPVLDGIERLRDDLHSSAEDW